MIPPCDDVGTPGELPEATPGEPVTMVGIRGLSTDDVLFLPGHELDDQVFVPGFGPEVTFRSLPPEVRRLITDG